MDIYQSITQTIVDALEKCDGKVILPWHRGGANGLPSNAHTGKNYRGINIVSLWVQGLIYERPVWASYLQWQQLGCQVKKGEKGTPIVYYSELEKEDDNGDTKRVPFLKHSAVFNASQVEGYEAPDTPKFPPLERLTEVDRFILKTGAKVIEGGGNAYYSMAEDAIHMPDGKRFFDTETSTRTESYYATLMHELTHLTGHPKRLNRDMSGRFGSASYAMEELVAEIGSAFLCASLHITPEPRPDHARYISNWIQVLKGDKRAVFTAANLAQLAADYLLQSAPA